MDGLNYLELHPNNYVDEIKITSQNKIGGYIQWRRKYEERRG